MHPPRDDTRLLWEADGVLDALGPPTEEALRALVAERGIDLATAVLYQHVRRTHRDFLRAVDTFDPGPPAAFPRLSGTLLLVPASGYVEQPGYGGDGAVIRGVGEAFGLSSTLVRTRSLGGVRENVPPLQAALAACPPRSVWLVTLSKGAAEVKLALRDPGPHRDALRAWVNVGGLPNGTPLVDQGYRDPRSWLVAHLLLLSGRAQKGFFYEMFHRTPLLAGPVGVPPDVPTVSVVGFPLSWHLSGTIGRRHAALAPLGPNDGFGLLLDAMVPGAVYPVWGGSHYLRVPMLSRVFYGIFAWLADRRPPQETSRTGSPP